MIDAEKVRSLFLAAIERDPTGACPTSLDGACDGDEALRARVERLLEAHRALGPVPVLAAGPDLDGAGPLEGPGATVGPYKLLEPIGEGGMGRVFMAEQMAPVRRKVALKLIRAGMDSRQVIARFEAERQALAMMDHPNIARVLDAGATEHGRPYFVMELVRGIPITEYCDREHLPVPARLELFLLVCRAVQHAHQKGIIHRDLKPSNVLVTLHDGVPVPKVIDFGVAKATAGGLTEKTLFTGFAQMVGTPAYMSPEQAELSGLDIDTRSDIYSLGVLLYELLTGTTPFDPETLRLAAFDEMRRIIREQEPQKPSTRLSSLGATLAGVSARRGADARRLNRAVRGELDWVVMRAMEKDRRRRYETAGALAADVIFYLTDRPVQACPPSAWYRLGKVARRNRVVLLTAELIALALVAGMLASAWQAHRAVRAERRAVAALAVAERNERTSRRLWYGSQLLLIQRELADGRFEFAQGALERLRPAPGERDLRGFAWHYLHRLARREVSLLFGHESHVYSLALSPDGHTLVSGDEAGVLIFWDLVAWRPRARVQAHRTGIPNLAFSPDGRTVASATSANAPPEVKLWDPATAREAARVPVIRDHVGGVVFSHDGRTLAVSEWRGEGTAPDGRVRLWKITPGFGLSGAEPVTIAGAFLAASPDRRLLATASTTGPVTIRHAATGRAIRTLPGSWSHLLGLAFTPDGRSVFVHDARALMFFDLATGREMGRLPPPPLEAVWMQPHPDFGTGPSVVHGRDVWCNGTRPDPRPMPLEGATGTDLRFLFSPDGRTLAGAGRDQSATLWDVPSWKRRAAYPLQVQDVGPLAFTPRGDSLIFGASDGRIRSWNLTKAAEPLDRLAGHDAEVWALAYAPDGRTLASGSDDHTIRLWDPRDGTLRATLAGHTSLVAALAVSPDGRTLASGSFDETVRLWDLPSGQPRGVLKGHTDRVRGVAFSPDGRLLASCSSDLTIRLHDAHDGRLLRVVTGPPDGLHDLAFSPDGARLAAACNDGSVRVWGLADDRPPITIPGPKACLAVAFSADGSLLAAASDRGRLAIWDTATWERRLHSESSDAAIRKLSFSPDGRTLAAACDDARVRLWDPATGQLTLLLDGHRRRVNAAAFSPDGSTLATASHDGAVRLWQAGPS